MMHLFNLLKGWLSVTRESHVRAQGYFGHRNLAIAIGIHHTNCVIGVRINNKPFFRSTRQKEQHMATGKRCDKGLFGVDIRFYRIGYWDNMR